MNRPEPPKQLEGPPNAGDHRSEVERRKAERSLANREFMNDNRHEAITKYLDFESCILRATQEVSPPLGGDAHDMDWKHYATFPIVLAVNKGNLPLLKLLTNSGADLNKELTNWEWASMMWHDKEMHDSGGRRVMSQPTEFLMPVKCTVGWHAMRNARGLGHDEIWEELKRCANVPDGSAGGGGGGVGVIYRGCREISPRIVTALVV
ncbi:hypothetical protein QBC44DRAFT_313582 [Cladorrhinum sp. PSN332]|nr:hypothetical protein QBC44DRAFT_313582 [Cladorrhinum sp. PSN332]